MIEGLKNLREIPVTVYRSSDAGAPELVPSMVTFKNIIKSCLVTGYGDKQPLGWDMVFETDNYVAVKSASETSNKHVFIGGQKRDRNAHILCALDARGWNDYDGLFRDRESPIHTQGKGAEPWILIGHEKAFVFVMSAGVRQGGNVIYFGDVPSLIDGWMGNTYLLAATPGNYGNYNGIGDGSSSSNIIAFPPLSINPVDVGFSSIYKNGNRFGSSSLQFIAFPTYITYGEWVLAPVPGILTPQMNHNGDKGGFFDLDLPGFEDWLYASRIGNAYYNQDGDYQGILINKKSWLGV